MAVSFTGGGNRVARKKPLTCRKSLTDWWFSPGPPVSFHNKTDRHDIIEVLLKVALNTTKQTSKHNSNLLITMPKYAPVNRFTVFCVL